MRPLDKEMPVMRASDTRARGNILVIEDDPDTADAVGLFLMREGFGVRCVPSRNDALLVLDSHLYDVIVMDYMMPGLSAAEFVKEARRRCPHSRFVLMTAMHRAAEQAGVLGIDNWIGKPFEFNTLLQTIRKC